MSYADVEGTYLSIVLLFFLSSIFTLLAQAHQVILNGDLHIVWVNESSGDVSDTCCVINDRQGNYNELQVSEI